MTTEWKLVCLSKTIDPKIFWSKRFGSAKLFSRKRYSKKKWFQIFFAKKVFFSKNKDIWLKKVA